MRRISLSEFEEKNKAFLKRKPLKKYVKPKKEHAWIKKIKSAIERSSK